MSIWKAIAKRYPLTEDDIKTAQDLVAEYKEKGYIAKTCLEMLTLSDGAIIAFYNELSNTKSLESPVKRNQNSEWMADIDFCFVNIRATGIGEKLGNMIQASKLFPVIRADGLHLGPFTEYDFHVIYAVTSVETISEMIINKEIENIGFNDQNQLKALVEAAHMLGKTVGFDIEPHVAQFAKCVIMHPDLFRWIRLAENKEGLYNGLSMEEIVKEEEQEKIVEDIRKIVGEELNNRGLKTIEEEAGDFSEEREKKKEAYHFLIRKVIRAGYWTITSQAWNGFGVPTFNGYNFEHKYAKYLYLSENGEDVTKYAYHILTPFKFYKNLPINKKPDTKPELYKPAVEYFCNVFLKWRDEYDFDFVRYDSVDHIFDSAIGKDYALSDRPTPDILNQCIAASKSGGKKYVGNLAERMGNEIEQYEEIGYDLILGSDMLERIDSKMVEKSFDIDRRLRDVNRKRESKFSVPFCVDTHDTGNPFIWGEPLLKVMGNERMHLRHFFSRFIGTGISRRPKYEVIGAQDMSYGLYESNVTDKNLVWIGDKGYNKKYHLIEDIYEQYKGMFGNGEIVEKYWCEDYAWWIIRCGGRYIIPLIALEKLGNSDSYNIGIGLEKYRGRDNISLVEYDFTETGGKSRVVENGWLRIEYLKYLEFKLFVV